MVVGLEQLSSIISILSKHVEIALDTETTGLRPYHGDKLFSLILAVSPTEAYYFNFIDYPEAKALDRSVLLNSLAPIWQDASKTWIMHNAKFDLAMLANEGIFISGQVYCTMAMARVAYNDQMDFSLDGQLKKIGLTKDDRVETWIKENVAFEKVKIPGRQRVEKKKFYYHVPFPIISEYGLSDAKGTFALQKSQEKLITGTTMEAVRENEKKLTQILFNMERVGVQIDLPFCQRAKQFEEERSQLNQNSFSDFTKQPYKASPLLFKEVFKNQEGQWEYTEKGNPSFDSSVLAKWDSPLAKVVLEIRDAKSKADFYSGFEYHADCHGRVHPTFNQHGAAHGRKSSSNPNFQNLTKEEGTESEFVVRRAIIPTPGMWLVSIDYKTMEYVLMLEYACMLAGRLTPLAEKVVQGHDVHEATAELATRVAGFQVTRTQAKTSNFLTLYGGGAQKLADQLKISLEAATKIRGAIAEAAPEIGFLQRQIMMTAKTRGFTRNWLGRRCYFPTSDLVYRGPNYVIAGGCADVMKVGMVKVASLLENYMARMIMVVHDELILEMPKEELGLIPVIQKLLESAYPAKYLSLKCSVSLSQKSLADLEDYGMATG